MCRAAVTAAPLKLRYDASALDEERTLAVAAAAVATAQELARKEADISDALARLGSVLKAAKTQQGSIAKLKRTNTALISGNDALRSRKRTLRKQNTQLERDLASDRGENSVKSARIRELKQRSEFCMCLCRASEWRL